MDDSKMKIIEQIAGKLGVSIDRLWSALIHQAFIDGAINIVSVFFLLSFLSFVFGYLKKKTTKSDDRPVPEWDHEASTVAWIVFCLFSFAVVLILLSNMPEIYAAIFNPEYWALMKILGRF